MLSLCEFESRMAPPQIHLHSNISKQASVGRCHIVRRTRHVYASMTFTGF